MNRTLQYFNNIKLNSLVNKTIANYGKKKITINIKLTTKNHQYLIKRQMSTKSRPLSFNTGPFNQPPQPPFDNRWIIAAALICGTVFNLQKK